jgi:hypothetical protein
VCSMEAAGNVEPILKSEFNVDENDVRFSDCG